MVCRVAATVAAVGCLLAAATVAHAAPGDLDPTFGNGGVARVDLGLREFANGMAIASDGKIVLGGTQLNSATFASALLAARLTATGALDTSFGQGTGFRTLGVNDTGDALALQPDGAILVAGSRNRGPDYDMLVARFRGSDGLLDPTFASGAGFAVPDFGANEFARAITLAPNGKIVLGGSRASGTSRTMVALRLNVPDGTPDTTYSFSGMRQVSGKFGDTDATAVALEPNGDAILAGALLDGFGAPTNILIGQVALNGSSYQHLDVSGTAKAMIVQPDGKVLLAGYSGSPTDFVVAREVLGSDGFFAGDSSFGNGGILRIDLGGTDTASAVALQADGKIVVAGTTQSGSVTQAAVVRLQPSGILDTTFGHGGSVVVPVPGGGKQTINALALRSDGTILLAGSANSGSSSTQDLLVMRLQGDNGPGGSGDGGGGVGGGGTGGGGGGTSARVPRCEGRKATIVGTGRADKLKGTRRADVIVALGGNDRIDGKGGNDVICAGDGNDTVVGGLGNDRIDGGNGKDTLEGGDGKDVLAGQGGKDRLLGGPGKDTLKGGAASDVLLGGSGANTLRQ